MNVFTQLMALRGIDICLILLFVLFSVAIVAGMIIVSQEQIARWVYRKVNAFVVKVEAFSKRYSYEDEFDPEWMDAQKFMESER